MKRLVKVPTPLLVDVREKLRRAEEPPVAMGPPPISFRDSRRADEAIPFGLRVAAGLSWRVIVIAVALYGLGRVIALTSSVVIPVAVALLLTSLAMPLAVFFNHKLRFPRALAALATLIIGLGSVGGLLYVAGNQVLSGFQDLSGQAMEGLSQVQGWLSTGPLAGAQLDHAVAQAQAWLENNVGTLTSGAVAGAVTAGNLAVGTIMTLFAVFFFLSDGDRMWSWCVRLAPKDVRTPIHEAGRRGWVTLSSYVKTQVIVAAADGVFITLGAWLLDLPLAIPLGLIVFFSASIPIVGAVVSGALAVLLALVVQGPLVALAMMAVVIGVQQIESNLLQPILMSKAVSLHPLATLLGVAAGSYLFGIVGALFAVPIMAVTNTVTLYLNGHDKFPMLQSDASVLTTSAKELTGDKKISDAEAAQAEPESKLLGGVTPERYEEAQRVKDEQAEKISASESDNGDATESSAGVQRAPSDDSPDNDNDNDPRTGSTADR